MKQKVVRCSGWREVQLQNVGSGITVMYVVRKKDVFHIATTYGEERLS